VGSSELPPLGQELRQTAYTGVPCACPFEAGISAKPACASQHGQHPSSSLFCGLGGLHQWWKVLQNIRYGQRARCTGRKCARVVTGRIHYRHKQGGGQGPPIYTSFRLRAEEEFENGHEGRIASQAAAPSRVPQPWCRCRHPWNNLGPTGITAAAAAHGPLR
jgi:hypothetical protein